MFEKFLTRRSMKCTAQLQPWDIQYFEHMCAEWRVLGVDENHADAKRVTELIRKFEHEGARRINRGHLLELEQTLLKRLSIDSLIQMAPAVRLRYRDIVGERQYAGYKEPEPPCRPFTDAARVVLADDLCSLVSAIHWRYILGPFRNFERIGLTISALEWMLFYTGLWGLGIWLATKFNGRFLPVIFTVLFAGIVGGFISALRRMQSIQDDSDSVTVIQAIGGAEFWLWLSPLLGAVFAMIAFLFFQSGLMSGTMFPKFTESAGTASAGQEWALWTAVHPVCPSDYGKLFLWSFIAGFAERFVPDMIDRIVQRTQNAQANASPTQMVVVTQKPE